MVVKLTQPRRSKALRPSRRRWSTASPSRSIAEGSDAGDRAGEGRDVQMAGQPWCEVGFEASFTKNLGNYQSARLNVIVKIPCPAGDIDEVFDYARTWVNGKLETLVSEL